MFYGLNTFLALYFMNRWHELAERGSQAQRVSLGTSIVGTLLGGWLADRFGRRAVIRSGFAGATLFLALFLRTGDRSWALALLVPLSIFIFLPTSVLVVLGQEYLPNRVGMASGVTLGLAVSWSAVWLAFARSLGRNPGLGRRILGAMVRARSGRDPGVRSTAGRASTCDRDELTGLASDDRSARMNSAL